MPLYVVFSEYQAPREKGEKIFPLHVAYMDQLQAKNKIFAAGPFTDQSGAMLILRQARGKRLRNYYQTILSIEKGSANFTSGNGSQCGFSIGN